MPDGRQKPSFWETVPGIITAIGTLIMAVAALITALYSAKLIGYDSGSDAVLPSPVSSQSATRQLQEGHSEDNSLIHDIDTTGSPFLGTKNAPVTLVVFSEFQCHFCRKAQPLLDKILIYNPSNTKVVFKHLPLDMHKQARPAALAAIAAHEQGKFWEMHDALFAIADNLNQETIKKAAVDIGLDMEKFQKDWNSSATKQKLKKDMIDAAKAGVAGTPTLFINGRQVKGRGSNILQVMIDQELSEMK
jgi:protein-disulfide isomerase